MASARPARIILVGLPGSGKSTVGPLVARALGWRFIDLDREIEDRAGQSVAGIFAADGEPAFRRLEHEATVRLRDMTGVVLAPGGGWILDPANLAAVRDGSMVVYLRVSPRVALDRLRGEPGTRPLLAGADPEAALDLLAEAREASYLQANHTLNVNSMRPSEVCDSIVALATGSRPD